MLIGNEFVSVQNVKDLQTGGKQWLESLLGRHLQENQQICIMVLTPGIDSDANRRDALQEWERITHKVRQHMQQQGITDEEYDAAVDETMAHIRARRK